MAEIVIRGAELADVDSLGDVFRRSSLSNEGDRPNLLASPDVLEFEPTAVHDRRCRVAIVEGRLVGFATVRPIGDGVELEDLFVDPDWMRQGIGLALVRDATAMARASGVTRIEVTANPHASEFYERAGFVPDGTAHTQFGPAPRMRLDLSR